MYFPTMSEIVLKNVFKIGVFHHLRWKDMRTRRDVFLNYVPTCQISHLNFYRYFSCVMKNNLFINKLITLFRITSFRGLSKLDKQVIFLNFKIIFYLSTNKCSINVKNDFSTNIIFQKLS